MTARLRRRRRRGRGRRLPAAARDQGPAALHHLRQRRRRQEHADRPPAVRNQGRCSTTSSRRWKPTAAATARRATTIDYALLLDGLAAEREQGITIDVAYRFFSTDKRKFIVADCPGHEQYTRNMATGASTADVAVVLVDARKGLLTQTRRHSYIVSLLGIRHVLLAVNKMDLVGYDQAVFDEIVAGYRELAAQLGIANVTGSAAVGAARATTCCSARPQTPWYDGPSVLEYLESGRGRARGDADVGFRLPVQWVNRPEPGFPRLCRHHRRRRGAAGRRDRRAAVGPALDGRAHRHRRRRPRHGRRRPGHHADAGATRSTSAAAT